MYTVHATPYNSADSRQDGLHGDDTTQTTGDARMWPMLPSPRLQRSSEFDAKLASSDDAIAWIRGSTVMHRCSKSTAEKHHWHEMWYTHKLMQDPFRKN